MTPTELQALLDREGVPMEARAAITLRKSGEYEDGAPAWFSDIGTEVPDDLAELAHVGAMVRWLISEGYHSIEFDTDDNSVVSLALYDREFSVQPTRGVEATTVLLAMACGRIAKEKADPMNCPKCTTRTVISGDAKVCLNCGWKEKDNA